MEKIFRTIALLAMVWSQLTAFPAEAEDAKTQPLPRFSDYRLVDSELKFVGIDSDATESFLALQLDSAGRLFAGGREAAPSATKSNQVIKAEAARASRALAADSTWPTSSNL